MTARRIRFDASGTTMKPMRRFVIRLGRAYSAFGSPFRLQLQRLLRRRTVTLEAPDKGLAFRCLAGADRMFAEIYGACHYRIPLAPVGPMHLVVDVGANHGFVAADFARDGAEVWAFEPSPRVYRLLTENLARNGLANRVRAEQVAVSDRDEEITLFETEQLGGGMSSTSPRFVARTQSLVIRSERVRSRAITSILSEIEGRRIRLLKLDCEGSELAIISAVSRQDRERIDSVALEYHPEAYDLESLVAVLREWDGFDISVAFDPLAPSRVIHLVRHEVALESVLVEAP